jgi:effector-binding domain-containing protein
MLEERRLAIEQEVVRQRARLSAVESRLAAVEEGESGGPVIDVVVRPVAPQLVAAIRTRVEEPGTVTALFEELEREVARQGARAAGPPALVLHDADYRECGLGVEVAVPLERPVRPTGRVACCELPGAERMACAMHSGGYAEIDRAAAALLLWAERSGLAPAGPLREVYLRFGADDSLGLPPLFLAATADEYLTELQLPVAPSPR